VFFDIDGTLVPGMSSGSFLAQRLGHAAELDAAESAYAAGTMDNDEVCFIDARGWTGRSVADVDTWLSSLPLVSGIAETTRWCRHRGLRPFLASLAWSVVGEHLARRLQFDGFCGPTLEVRDRVFTGSVSQVFDEYLKRDFALRTAAGLGLSPADCAAIGDSRSDVPLFEATGFSVAFNATAAAEASSSRTAGGDDLTAVIPLLDEWLGTSRCGT
jgi:phosphoserine phosphatase